jgi:hypothetical protein
MGAERTRRQSVFTQSDITKRTKGVRRAGLVPSSVVIAPDGSIKIDLRKDGAGQTNPWDSVLTDS